MAGKASTGNSVAKVAGSMAQSGRNGAPEDQRSSPRSAITMECDVALLDQPNQPFTRISLRDISTGGAAFDTSHPFRDNERLMIVMPLTDRAGRTVLGRIRYCKKLQENLYLAGVEFVEVMHLPLSLGRVRVPPKWLMPH